ncbi:MAG: helix-turn-helix domain-containing protein [Methylorubrum populi]
MAPAVSNPGVRNPGMSRHGPGVAVDQCACEPAPTLPVLRYSTAGEPPEQAVETWRRLMKLMYSIDPAERNANGQAPGGGIAVYRVGSLLANRTVWHAQYVARDRRLADATPDHIAFQLCRSGSYHGNISGRTASLLPGTVAVANRRRMLAGNLAADTMGLIVPRHLFAGVDTDALAVRFDAARNRLLGARVDLLYRSLPRTRSEAVPALETELIGFLRRLLDPSQASDVLEGPELDVGQFALAERFVLSRLGDPHLAPEHIAAALKISRATLYRLFAPVGGVSAYVQDQRFLAFRDALADPLEARSLTRLAEVHGIRSAAHLSRSFRARFGASPRAWRERQRTAALAEQGDVLGPARAWWSGFRPPGPR